MPVRNGTPPKFGLPGLFARLLLTLFLVFATYNPSGRSYYHWIVADGSGPLSLQIGAGLLLVCAMVVTIRSGTASFGRVTFVLGLLAIVLLGTGLRTLLWGTRGSEIAGYAMMAAIAVWLTLGLSWPHLSRRLTGQHQYRKV